MRASLALLLCCALAGCAGNSTAIAAGAIQVEELHKNTSDAFLAVVEQGGGTEAAKQYYRDRIAANMTSVRLLTAAQVDLAEALGKIDWTGEALKLWKLYREEQQKKKEAAK